MCIYYIGACGVCGVCLCVHFRREAATDYFTNMATFEMNSDRQIKVLQCDCTEALMGNEQQEYKRFKKSTKCLKNFDS